METYKSFEELFKKEKIDSLAITIGNFDGVHLGHQEIIHEIKQKEVHRSLAVVTFYPHPRAILSPGLKGFLLTSPEKKRDIFSELGVDYLVELPFNRDFSTQAPQEFLDNYILKHKKIERFYFGYDFSFGSMKMGSFDYVNDYLQKKKIKHLKPIQLKGFKQGQDIISSTLIRKLVVEGNIEKANKYLSREYELDGLIEKGAGRGKKIGFPTANLACQKEYLLPGKGVYITRSTIEGLSYHSVTNVGVNPTFQNSKQGDCSKTIECHILDFERDIYGESLKISFIKKLRNEVRFDSVNDLVIQIKNDIHQVIEFFKLN